VLSIWKRYCPVFLQITDYHNPKQYWEAIAAILLNFTPCASICNPTNEFCVFLEILFLFKNVLYVQNEIDFLSLLRIVRQKEYLSIFLYNSPLHFENSVSFFEIVFQYIQNPSRDDYPLMKKDICSIFDHYSFYLSSLNQDFQMIVRCVLFRLIQLLPPNSDMVLDLSTKYLEKVSESTKNKNITMVINLTRDIVTILSFSSEKKIIESVTSIVNTLMCHQDINLLIPLFKYIMISNSFEKTLEISIIESIVSCRHKTHGMIRIIFGSFGIHRTSIMCYLARIALKEYVWHRTCFGLILELLELNISDKKIVKWFQKFCRRIIIFVSISNKKGKYINKSLLICESLSRYLKITSFIKIRDIIESCVTSVFSLKSIPLYFPLYFSIGKKLDDILIEELSVYDANLGVKDMKNFPFQKGSNLYYEPNDVLNSNSKSSPLRIPKHKNR